MSADNHTEVARIKRRLMSIGGGMVLITAVSLFVLALQSFERKLLPEIDAKVAAVSRSLETQFDRAAGLDIPLDRLRGVDDVLDETLAANPELAYVAITDTAGDVLFARGRMADEARAALTGTHVAAIDRPLAHRQVGDFREVWVPVQAGSQRVGTLHVGVPATFVLDAMHEIALDLGVALLVSLLATFEFLLFLTNRALTAPIWTIAEAISTAQQGDFRHTIGTRTSDEVGRLVRAFNHTVDGLNARFHALSARLAALPQGVADGSARLKAAITDVARFEFAAGLTGTPLRRQVVTDIRTPLFLYVLAGEMSRSFFPNYVKGLYVPIPGLPYETVVGLPISAFMFVVAASTPSSGGWADRIGGRKLFLLSVAPTLIGLLGTGFAQNIYQLLTFWCLNAIGYAMATIACQSRIAESTSGENRAQGMAVFVTAIMVAAICGTSFGGVISDRIGFRATFMVSAVMVLLAALIVANVFLDNENYTETKRISTIKALKEASRNGRYLSLLLLGAVPAKLILTGFLFYLVPLYLADLGHTQSAIGREMMAYFAVMVIMSPMLAKVADKYRLRLSMVVSGGLMAGLGAVALPLVGQADIGVLIAVVTLGIGHALGTAPLIAMIPEVAEHEARTLGQTALLGTLRVTERVGSVLGPVVAALLVARFSYPVAAQAIGGVVMGSALLLLLSFWLWSFTTGKAGLADKAS